MASLVGQDTVEILAGAVLLRRPEGKRRIAEALGQVLAGLPVDLDGLGDEPRGAILADAEVERLVDDAVGEPLVLREVELDV